VPLLLLGVQFPFPLMNHTDTTQPKEAKDQRQKHSLSTLENFARKSKLALTVLVPKAILQSEKVLLVVTQPRLWELQLLVSVERLRMHLVERHRSVRVQLVQTPNAKRRQALKILRMPVRLYSRMMRFPLRL
jgi:hypothetical protein